jgi:serine/threonine protein kinase
MSDPTSLNSENASGVNLKDFNIVERLGKGSFGSVYFVEKKSNTQKHAMKVLEKEKILK